METVEAILAELVAFDTTSRNSNLALIDCVEAYLARHGVAAWRVPSPDGEKANLFASIGPDREGGFVLSGHTDTVPVDGQDWSSDPFTLSERSGLLYGRGSCDMKGFLAACLARVPAMQAAGLKRPIHLAFSYDEEVGCLGVPLLLDALGTRGIRPEGCFVGEPTEMQPVIAHKAKRSMRAFFNGKSVHSSLSPDGVNAVSYAARLVAWIDALTPEMNLNPGDALFDVPVSTAHVGVFSGGTALNIVPAQAQVDFEFRTLPGEDADARVAAARDVIAGLDAEMAARDPACGARLEMLAAFPGLDTPEDAPITRLAKRLAGRNDHAKVAYGTEAGLFAERAGIPTVVIGPGSIGEAHKPDEFIARAELDKCTRFLDRLIEHCSTA